MTPLKRFLLFAAFGLCFFFLFFISDSYFHSVDKRIYTYYTESLVTDFDFNVINQIPLKEAWLLTPTLNYPDVHSNGVSLLWAPFFASAHLVSMASPLPISELIRNVQPLANLFWGLFALLLLWLWLCEHYPKSTVKATLAVILLASPFYWFLLYQPGNADITSLVVALLLLSFYDLRHRFRPFSFCLLFGVFLFTGAAIKVDLIFYGLLMVHYFYEHRKCSLTSLLKRVVGFLIGSLAVLAPLLYNESLKDGFLNNAYMSTITGKSYVLLENLFAPSGYISTQPFWLIAFFGFLTCLFLWRGRMSSLSVFLFFIPITELVLESFTYNQNEGFSARHWINDLPCWSMAIAATLYHCKSSIWKRTLLITAGIGAVFSLCACLVYRLDFDAYYFTGDWTPTLTQLNRHQLLYFIRPKGLEFKLALTPVAALAIGILFFLWARRNRLKSRFFRVGFPLFMTILYCIATAGNALNNSNSPKEVPKRVAHAVIGKGPHINSFFENAGCLQRAVRFYEIRGDLKMAMNRQALLENYVLKAAEEIVSDPVQFKKTLVPGKKYYVPDKLRTDE